MDFNTLPLSVDVLSVLNLFTKLDGAFSPCTLIILPGSIRLLSPAVRRQLVSLCPTVCEGGLWAVAYLDVVREYRHLHVEKPPRACKRALIASTTGVQIKTLRG